MNMRITVGIPDFIDVTTGAVLGNVRGRAHCEESRKVSFCRLQFIRFILIFNFQQLPA